MGLFSRVRRKLKARRPLGIQRFISNQQQPQPIQEVEMSGVGTLPLKNLRLPDFLQRVPNPMENLPNLNIPTGIQNLKFSPDFGNYVPMFDKGMMVDQEAISATPSMLVFNLNLQAENLMNQMLMEQANGEIERAMETGRQIQNINDQIAQIKGEFGDKSYMVDKALTDFTNMRNRNNNLRAVPFKFRAGNKPDASYYRRGAPERVEIDKREKQKEALDKFLSPVPGFSGGGGANKGDIPETIATASRIKKPTTVLTDFSDPLVDVEQEELLADLVKKAELQSLIEELLEDRGRTVSDLDMMTILQQSSSGQPSMV